MTNNNNNQKNNDINEVNDIDTSKEEVILNEGEETITNNKQNATSNSLKVTDEEKEKQEKIKLTPEQKRERRKFMIYGSLMFGSLGLIVFIISVILYSVL